MAKETFRVSNPLISVLILSCKTTFDVALDLLLADKHAQVLLVASQPLHKC